jgi:tripartite-type tricarboxylate transporter receptor subunit TctC
VRHGVPRNIVEKIAADVTKIVRSPELKPGFDKLGVDPEGSTPAEYQAFFNGEVEKYRKVIKAAGISGD